MSKIEWTDATWNPVVGCTRVSAGCDNCYAVTMSHRLEGMGRERYAGLTVLNNRGERHFKGEVRTVPEVLDRPLRWRKPRMVFVNSMSDLFHPKVPFDFIDRVFAVMALCPQHTFQILTKRPERTSEYLDQVRTATLARVARDIKRSGVCEDRPSRLVQVSEQPWPLPNVWLGTSVENQQAADERIPHLLKCPAAVRFLSCEPLLGPVELPFSRCIQCGHSLPSVWNYCPSGQAGSACTSGIHWVIVGGESGKGARPMHPDWARSIRDQCIQAGVPYFFKQWGAWCPAVEHSGQYLHGETYKPLPKTAEIRHDDPTLSCMARVGKKAAGRLLDGRTWDEFPDKPTEMTL